MWQQALVEAAQRMKLEAHLVGDGLPGSFVTVDIPPITLLDDNGMDDHTEYVYNGIKVIVHMQRGRNLECDVVQLSVGALHPHVETRDRHMCLGGGHSILSGALPRGGDNSDPSAWMPFLMNVMRIVRNHHPSGHYQDHGYVNIYCKCLAEITGEPPGVPEGAYDRGCRDGGTCRGCTRRCSLCRGSFPNSEMIIVSRNSNGGHSVCKYCASEHEIHICEGCGSLYDKDVCNVCPITGIEVCPGCGFDYEGQIVHRPAIVRAVGGLDYIPCSLASSCTKCHRGVPFDLSDGRVYCFDLCCPIKYQLAGEQYEQYRHQE